jgi:hypothetical protein
MTLFIYVFHDLLPYHNHGMAHFITGGDTEVFSAAENGHHCDGHEMCLTCILKVHNQFEIKHHEIDFPVSPTDLVLKIDHIKISVNYCSYLFQNDQSHKLKSKYHQLPHSLRAPPFIV